VIAPKVRCSDWNAGSLGGQRASRCTVCCGVFAIGNPPRQEKRTLKGKRFTDEQITYALRQAESGPPVADVCRQLGSGEASFDLWKKKFGKHGMTEIREMRQLRMR
jgi:hypothetical protein